MKKAKIYFEGNLITTVCFSSIMYIDGRELRDNENKLIAVVPSSHLIVIDNEFTFELNGKDLFNSINHTLDINNDKPTI